MSLVAVCCRSASCVSWKSRAFSIAIAAWSAKRLAEAHAPRSEKAFGGRAHDENGAESAVLPQHRRIEERRASVAARPVRAAVGDRPGSATRFGMWCMRRSRTTRPVTLSPSGRDVSQGFLGAWAAPGRQPAPSGRRRSCRCRFPRRRTASCSSSRILSNTGAVSATDALITPSTSAVAVCCSSASLRVVEQPHVLDRDHGLVARRSRQHDLLVGEGALARCRIDGSCEPTPSALRRSGIGARRPRRSIVTVVTLDAPAFRWPTTSPRCPERLRATLALTWQLWSVSRGIAPNCVLTGIRAVRPAPRDR